MNLRQALNQAVVQLLRPLVKVLLRHGVAYDEFAELARRTYVDVAERDFTLQGRKQTASRISVITGLNRKEVARLQALNSAEAHDAPGAPEAPGESGTASESSTAGESGKAVTASTASKAGIASAQRDASGADLARTMNRAAKVVVGWRHEHGPAGGEPQPLDAEQFAALVRRHSGDMPPRAVLDELRHAGALTQGDDGRYHLAPQGYVPQQTDVRKIALLGQHAGELLGTIEHNLAQPPDQAWLQQRVFADHIPAQHVDAVRARLRTTGLQALADTRQTLIDHDGGDATPLPGARRVSLGVYYFEEPAPAPAATPAPTVAEGEKE